MANPLDTILNTNPALPTYSGPQYAAPQGSPADISAQQQASQGPNPGMDIPGLQPQTPTIAGMMQPQTTATPDIPQPQMRGLDQQPADNFGGKLKNALQRFAYYGGQAAMKSVGLPTDDELNDQAIRNQQIQAATANIKQQMTMVPMTDEKGQPILNAFGQPTMVPNIVNQKQMQARIANQAKLGVAGINAGAKIGAAQIGADSRENVANIQAQGRTPTKIGLILKANAGDAEAKQALDTLHQQDLDLMNAKGAAFGKGRLWSLQRAMDPDTGESGFYTGFGILQAQQDGKRLIPMGALSAKDLISVQQLTSEASPAIKGVMDNVGAFDNANDRAIFARVMKGAGSPTRGQEASWMGNVLNQALKEGLSPEGQQLAIKEQRLAETMGRLRSTLGLPATDQSMAITLGLLPGASTPNAKYARDQVQQLKEMVDQATRVPIFGGAGNAPLRPMPGENTTPPPSGMVTVELNGRRGQIPAANKAQFLKENPGAKVF